MTKAESMESVLFAELPSAVDEQFRMRQLSIYNWGTFSRLHTMRIAEDGSLILGPSGAGKSTLLDAISAMIVPPRKLHFNAAAEEGERGRRDRTLVSYVRGAWAERGAMETRDVSTQYLRPDSTWSAIALQYGNRQGRVITLVRLFWINGSASNATLNKYFMVVEGAFDLAVELSDFDGDKRKLRQHLDRPGIRPHDDFAAYQEHWCRIMGIDDPTALELLHQTQSTKNLGDLNGFLREFMLAKPATFEKAERLVEEFQDLDDAHMAVVAARQQIEVLDPARTAHGEYEAIHEQMRTNETLVEAAPAFIEYLKVGLIEADLLQLTTTLKAAEGQRDSVNEQIQGAKDEITSLERQHHEHGGGNISVLEGKVRDLTGERERRSRNKQKASGACADLGWNLAEDAGEFAVLLADATAVVSQIRDRAQSLRERRDALAILRRDQEAEFKSLRAEIESLECSPSNIPSDLQQVRTRLCAALGIPAAQALFVGELLQVRKEDQKDWAPAAERLLGGFGRDLIIDQRHHKRVAMWVNDNHLGQRLVYHPVEAGQSSSPRSPRTPHSIIDKLDIKPCSFSGWLHRELVDRFDYECVGSAAELTRGDYRITDKGQIRHGRGRSEKDDRRYIGDRKNWVLGFDSREKLELYQSEAQALSRAMVETMAEVDTLEKEGQQDHVRQRAAQRLLDIEWSDIDVATTAGRIAELEAQLTSLRVGNPTLANLDGQLVSVRTRLDQLQERAGDLRSTISDALRRRESQELQLERARVEAGAISVDQRDALEARLSAGWEPSLANVSEGVQKAVSALHAENRKLVEEKSRLEQAVTFAFAEFLRRWPEEGGALQVNLAAAPDFFARLSRIEVDGLPEHETRFLNLLRTQSGQRLAELSRHMSEARREIVARLQDVNDALEIVPYNPDSYLQIESVDLHLPEAKEFRERLNQVFADQARQVNNDATEAEQQFKVLRELVLDLKNEEKRRWRDKVLDVRQHVEFMAEELERGTDRQIEVYSGSSGKSGGQRQKLTATCLAAALRYKLGGVDGGPPQYAAVVLDEAFTKTDNDFTATCMRIFTELGFQMIVATPIKSVMTLEEFVGGAVYVTISNRHTSAMLHIDYDAAERRLAWSDESRLQAELEDADT